MLKPDIYCGYNCYSKRKRIKVAIIENTDLWHTNQQTKWIFTQEIKHIQVTIKKS